MHCRYSMFVRGVTVCLAPGSDKNKTFDIRRSGKVALSIATPVQGLRNDDVCGSWLP